jgi:hypothetical protein
MKAKEHATAHSQKNPPKKHKKKSWQPDSGPIRISPRDAKSQITTEATLQDLSYCTMIFSTISNTEATNPSSKSF